MIWFSILLVLLFWQQQDESGKSILVNCFPWLWWLLVPCMVASPLPNLSSDGHVSHCGKKSNGDFVFFWSASWRLWPFPHLHYSLWAVIASTCDFVLFLCPIIFPGNPNFINHHDVGISAIKIATFHSFQPTFPLMWHQTAMTKSQRSHFWVEANEEVDFVAVPLLTTLCWVQNRVNSHWQPNTKNDFSRYGYIYYPWQFYWGWLFLYPIE